MVLANARSLLVGEYTAEVGEFDLRPMEGCMNSASWQCHSQTGTVCKWTYHTSKDGNCYLL